MQSETKWDTLYLHRSTGTTETKEKVILAQHVINYYIHQINYSRVGNGIGDVCVKAERSYKKLKIGSTEHKEHRPQNI